MPARRQAPVFVPRASYYSAAPVHHYDYGIDDSINRAEYFSNAVLDDTYDAAAKSRGRDHELLRNANAAIRPYSRSPSITRETRTGRQSKRFRSLPPVEAGSHSPSTALVPYRRQDGALSNLSSTPSPSSLLSTRINTYLRGSSVPPLSGNNSISYRSYLSDPMRDTINYRSYLSDPSILSPFATRSSSRMYHGYVPNTLSRSISSPSHYRDRYNYRINDDEDEDDEDSYRRRYRILRGPGAIAYSKSTDEDEDTESVYEPPNGTYSSSRPSGASYVKLSDYDGPYDGSYDADMAEMYDYVPFGPSRQGILELTTDDTSSAQPHSTLTSSYVTHRPLSPPEPLPTVSLTPLTSKSTDDSLTRHSFANNPVLDSLVSNTAARAKAILAESKLPEYKNASLVLSVEGSAVTEDGQNRYGFRYYPPPIPLKGSTIGIDERILGITPSASTPADSFLGSYLDRLRSLRSDVRDPVNTGDRRSPSRSSSVIATRTPSYTHRTIQMPLTIAGRANSVPVSSYRSRLDDGQSHRVDVYPLVVSETSVPAYRKFQLPVYSSGSSANRLTVLEKINIKAAIIGSRMEAEDGGRYKRARSQFATNKLRELKIEDMEPNFSRNSLHRQIARRTRSSQRPGPVPIYVPPVKMSQPRMSPIPPVNVPDPVLNNKNKPSVDREMEGGSSVKIPDYYYAGGDPNNMPMSDLRRRIRRTITRTKGNPNYYKME